MGKADFSHLASQNVLLIIVLVVFVLLAVARGVGHDQRYTNPVIFLFPADKPTIPEIYGGTQYFEKQWVT